MAAISISKNVIVERISWVSDMVDSINRLPLDSKEAFLNDPRNVASAESYLRRALEASFDIGRHILAKGFSRPVTEYKEVAKGLVANGVLSENEGNLLIKMAGYRNRMVHFYNEITPEELYEICTGHLDDIGTVIDRIKKWLKENDEG